MSRRQHSGNGGGPGGAAAAAADDAIEKQNENALGTLHSKLLTLKNVTIAIKDEVNDQNRALDQMQTGMGSTDNLLSSTLNRMGVMFDNNGSKSTFGLACLIVVVFFTMYYVSRWLLYDK
mmetsp:Transcript_34298/g.77257  ORF Transcript_34298/g.77257 Transcript_34298/m.77257 type:complete len:120 (+) Transcript_34298:1-360(+)